MNQELMTSAAQAGCLGPILDQINPDERWHIEFTTGQPDTVSVTWYRFGAMVWGVGTENLTFHGHPDEETARSCVQRSLDSARAMYDIGNEAGLTTSPFVIEHQYGAEASLHGTDFADVIIPDSMPI